MQLSRRQFLAASAGVIASPLAAADKPKKLVLIAGTPSHPPGIHEFNAGTLLLARCLKEFPGLELSVNLNGWPKNEAVFDDAAGILIYADGGSGHPGVQDKRLEFLGKLMAKGVGLMCAHYGVEVLKDKGGKEFQDWIGGYYENAWSCNPIWRPGFKEFPKHPIANGVKPFSAEPTQARDLVSQRHKRPRYPLGRASQACGRAERLKSRVVRTKTCRRLVERGRSIAALRRGRARSPAAFGWSAWAGT